MKGHLPTWRSNEERLVRVYSVASLVGRLGAVLASRFCKRDTVMVLVAPRYPLMVPTPGGWVVVMRQPV